jgi:hypothetical protein
VKKNDRKFIESELKMSKILAKFEREAKFNHQSFSSFYSERRYATRTMFHLFFVLNKERHALDETFAVRSRELIENDNFETIEVDACVFIRVQNEVFEICDECLRYRDFHFSRESFEQLSSSDDIIERLRQLADIRSSRNLRLFKEFLIEHEEFLRIKKVIAMIALRLREKEE